MTAPPVDIPAVVAEFKGRLQHGQAALRADYEMGGNALALLRGRSRLVDGVLRDLWSRFALPRNLALVAVGGYGRGELYPASDVDVLILTPEEDQGEAHRPHLERLIGLFWDISLDIGHSVRSIGECIEEAGRDITIQTTLVDARRICGSRKLFEAFQARFASHLDAKTFFKAKQLEQQGRYARYNDTPYSLEPNCKESPGGLRDLQVILWNAKAARIGSTWRALGDTVTREEADQLSRAESFLRHLRIRLHHISGRREDRLLFEHQEALAEGMGLQATPGKRASEVLMQRYYRNAKLVMQLNTLVLQNLGTRIDPGPPPPPRIIDDHFQVARGLLDIREDDLFEREPRAILESFLLMAQRPELKGMSTRTLRALWGARRRIDARFRRDPGNRALFISLFQQKRGVVHELRRMNQYDILGQYLPAFGRIVGQMQHDLFHVYTVDQHILQVVRNLRRLSLPEFAHEYPFCSQLMADFDRQWLLYVAALFHDIAKGRGGDHSKLGVADARRFCADHGIAGEDAELVAFLVEHHLTLSSVAQKQDLSDPGVIRAFADIVRTERRLTALYLLTVADIRGTSPKVWNGWRAKLLENLYQAALQLLRGDTPPQMARLAARQEEARAQLRYFGLRPKVEVPLWEQLDTAYFMRHDAEEIAWHTRTLYYRPAGEEPVVRARLNPIGEGLQVMVYVPDQAGLFARLCGFFARLGYSIAEARVHTTRHGYAMSSFILLDPGGHLPYRDMIALIDHDLVERLKQPPSPEQPISGRLSRQVKHFPIAPEVAIRPDEKGRNYILSIVASDRPGLLHAIALFLYGQGIDLHAAKIATLGERAEDTFLISGERLHQTATLVHLEQELLKILQ